MTHFVSLFGPLWGQAHLLSAIQSPEMLLYYWDTGCFYGCLIYLDCSQHPHKPRYNHIALATLLVLAFQVAMEVKNSFKPVQET